jgi:hypothetical protein
MDTTNAISMQLFIRFLTAEPSVADEDEAEEPTNCFDSLAGVVSEDAYNDEGSDAEEEDDEEEEEPSRDLRFLLSLISVDGVDDEDNKARGL